MNMGMGRVEFIFLCVVGLLAMVHVSYAQNSPQDYLNAHNAARAQVGVGPLTWDNRVAGFAQNYVNGLARTCTMVHSQGPYGENLARSSGDMTATAAVNMWVNERRFYNRNTNSCNGGDCLHYTQMVWRNSVRLGCAKARCNNGGGTIISCNYDPRGNINGQALSDLSERQ